MKKKLTLDLWRVQVTPYLLAVSNFNALILITDPNIIVYIISKNYKYSIITSEAVPQYQWSFTRYKKPMKK